MIGLYRFFVGLVSKRQCKALLAVHKGFSEYCIRRYGHFGMHKTITYKEF